MLSRLLVCLAVTAALSSRHLVATARSLPFGPERDLRLAVAEAVHRPAALLELDRPDRALTEALGRDPGPDPACGLPRRPCPTTATATTSIMGPPRPDDAVAAPPSEPALTVSPTAPAPAGPDLAGGTGPAGGGSTTATLAPGPASAPGLGPLVVDGTGVLTAPSVAGPTPSPVPLRPVDPASKLRLWAGGDSLGEYVGNQLLSPIGDRDLTAIELDYRISTGLARPDYFDWQARIDELAAREQPPDAMVFMVGGNDNQPMARGDQVLAVGSEPWFQEYRARVTDIMDSADTGSSHLWWIGLPPMRDHDRDSLSQAINAILAEEARLRPWVSYVDLSATFAGPDGGFSTRISGPDGTERVARAPDGVHITYHASTWVADQVWRAVGTEWQLAPAPD